MKTRKLVAIVLAIVMIVSYMPTTVSAEGSGTAGSFKDMPAESHWSTEALKAAVSNELINPMCQNGCRGPLKKVQ